MLVDGWFLRHLLEFLLIQFVAVVEGHEPWNLARNKFLWLWILGVSIDFYAF